MFFAGAGCGRKENRMNYLEWSEEYRDTADEIAFVMDKLKKSKCGKSNTEKKEIDLKISKYKSYYNECMLISNHLMARYEGIG